MICDEEGDQQGPWQYIAEQRRMYGGSVNLKQ